MFLIAIKWETYNNVSSCIQGDHLELSHEEEDEYNEAIRETQLINEEWFEDSDAYSTSNEDGWFYSDEEDC